MDKKQLKIALSVSDAVRNRFPETNELVEVFYLKYGSKIVISWTD